jgi:membrane dipeptidase
LRDRPGAGSLLEERFTVASDRVANSDDFRRATSDKANGRILTWYSVPADELSRAQEDAELWVLRGARFFALPGTRSSGIGTSWNDAVNRDVVGLSQLGWSVVNRIYGAGGIPDVSRASDATRDDVLRLANRLAKPVVALGSNARARADHPRNLTDAQLRAIGASDGLVGVTFEGPQLAVGRPATLRDVVVHVRHAVRHAGIEHVGIASGFNGPIRAPDGLENAARLPALARALLESGLSTEDVERIFHANAMRLLCPNGVR